MKNNNENSTTKTVYILSGISGSGKTTLAEDIKSKSKNVEICCADDYFTDEKGIYNFNPAELHRAHQECQDKFKTLLADDVTETIIVANTNTTGKEIDAYGTVAQDAGAMVFHLVVCKTHSRKDVHGVPSAVLMKQKERILNLLRRIL